MTSIEETFEQAVKNGVLPGAVLLAKDRSGDLNYAKAIGTRSIDANANPLKLDSIFSLASMTKLLTSIAAMQVVEKGLISLEDDVSSLLPELSKQPILHEFDSSGKPVTSERENPIKFVHLLTHSAGTAYEMMDPLVQRYRAYVGQPPNRSTMENKSAYPLRFEPGTYFTYSTAIDWAGVVVERLTGVNLNTYMQRNMFDPLGIKRIAFSPHITNEMQADLATITSRSAGTGRVENLTSPWITDGDVDCFGGHGGYADLQDYIKVMESLLKDDEVLLKKKSTAIMFSPHFTPEAKKGYAEFTAIPEVAKVFIGDFPDTVTYDWGIGGVLLDEDDTTTKRKKGTMIWSGMANCFWFIDRKAGVCGVFGTQVLPPGDEQVGELINLFEKDVYEKAGVV